jgi:hypothetical protein
MTVMQKEAENKLKYKNVIKHHALKTYWESGGVAPRGRFNKSVN